MNVRPISTDDFDAWLAFRCAFETSTDLDAHQADVERILADQIKHRALLCVDDTGQPVGFAEVSLRAELDGYTSTPVAFLKRLYVKPDARRSGAARALIAAAEKWATARGCRELASNAAPDDPLGHTVHTALGFEEFDRVVQFKKALAPRAAPTFEPTASEPHTPPSVPIAAARSQSSRTAGWGDWSGWNIVHAVVAILGVLCFFGSDISSPNIAQGAVYPLLASACIFYIAVLLIIRRYGRRTNESERGAELFKTDDNS